MIMRKQDEESGYMYLKSLELEGFKPAVPASDFLKL